MKKKILERYSRDSDGRIIIDIAASRVADLYNDLDRNTPYQKKDLAPGLVNYINEAVNEIGAEPFVLQFSLNESPAEDLRQRLKTSVTNYFVYLRALAGNRLVNQLRRMVILFLAAVSIIVAAIFFEQSLDEQAGVWQRVVGEGLTIAGWISAWESLATLLLEVPPLRRRMRRYQRIARADIHFK